MKEITVVPHFEDVPLMPWPQYTVNAVAFKYSGHEYVIITSDITRCRNIQLRYDESAGYTGGFKPYESMLFVDNESMDYPFGDLPGHHDLGIFQRYDTEEQARDGHQTFVTRVKRVLLKDK